MVTAEYELEHLLLEGHCFDLSTGQPPRGLQFTLGTSRDPIMYDTIVMANLVRSFLYSKLKLPRQFPCTVLDIVYESAIIVVNHRSTFGTETVKTSVSLMLTIITRASAVLTTTGIFPAESQSRCLDPEVTSREIRGYLSGSHVSIHTTFNSYLFLTDIDIL